MWIERMESNSVRMGKLCISETHPVNSFWRTMSSPMAPPRGAGILQSSPTGSSVELTALLWTLPDGCMWPPARSEEHTSELQSRSDLVCRLLLEKKKKPTIRTLRHTITTHTHINHLPHLTPP